MIIDEFFSNQLKNLLSSKIKNIVEIPNISKDFIELLIAGAAIKNNKNIIWINSENSDINKYKTKLEKWLEVFHKGVKVLTYSLPFGDPYISNQLNQDFFIEKNNILSSIKLNERIILITTLPALNIKCETPTELSKRFINISIGDILDRENFLSDLIDNGYKFEDFVENIGEMAKRGGVIDIFPVGFNEPVRIEIFGNEVSNITLFDSDSRLSTGKLETCSIPSGNILNENRYSYYHYQKNLKYVNELIPDNMTIVSDIDKLMQEFAGLLNTYDKLYELIDDEVNLPSPKKLFSYNLYKKGFINIPFVFDEVNTSVELKKTDKNLNNMTATDIENLKSKNAIKIFVFSKNKKLIEKLTDIDLNFTLINNTIPLSFENINTKAIFLTDKEIVFKRGVSKRALIKREDIINSIEIGEFVVHETHGIGIFLGFYTIKLGQNEQEFLKVEFSGKDYLYIPTYDAEILTKYFAFSGAPPKLDKIGGKTWSLKKSKAKKSILIFAKELLELYAMRQSIKGYSYIGDSDLEKKLEESFPYIETPDQKKAIKEVLLDLQKEYPMERLVCGDVSFGKTEVAIRASFRVVLEGKQVAVLCPTTILADQHFKTFQDRLKDFPLTIKKLSRMVTAAERREVIEQIKSGKIDILIGTHSIISKNVEFKRLGLLVIDEEQRFGVFQKELIKKNREAVDVLILSATPIPRTLSLSFAGLADISTISTPPPGRRAIKNYIGRYSKKIIISGILNEIERGGSVFIVYNSINKLYSFKEELMGWFDNISIAIIHAKMKPSEIDKNLNDFIDSKHQILLSTTIIENGIDITNVNTLIVIDADKFGLTQLYQLRGRIGRGKRQAYAYFLIRKNEMTEKAQLRLDGIRDFASIGAGFKLAEYDLKLRGAGALLGNKQHGHIESLGFEYYNDMLKRTIEELKGEKKFSWKGQINIGFNYSIDENYIKNGIERMKFYSEIAEANSFCEIDSVKEKTSNIYGHPGQETEKIFFVGKVKLLAKQFNIERVDINQDNISLKFPDVLFHKIIFPKIFIEKYMPKFESDNTVLFSFKNYEIFLNDLKKVLEETS